MNERQTYLWIEKHFSPPAYSMKSRKLMESAMRLLFEFLKEQDKCDLRKVGIKDLTDFILMMKERKNKRGRSYSPSTIHSYMSRITTFFTFLYEHEKILKNPTSLIEMNKQNPESEVIRLLSVNELDLFFDCMNSDKANEFRDRVLFELMYSSGLRISEAFESEGPGSGPG